MNNIKKSDILVFKKKTYFDKRGNFKEIFLKKNHKVKFVFDVVSKSHKNVIRGLHIQLKKPQGKLVTVLNGKILDVAVDCRKNSSSLGKYFVFLLSSKKNRSIYIPEGFAHGFLSLEDNTIVHYKCTNYREKSSEVGIMWNDRDLNIKWPKKKLYILSSKDKKNLSFNEFRKKYL